MTGDKKKRVQAGCGPHGRRYVGDTHRKIGQRHDDGGRNEMGLESANRTVRLGSFPFRGSYRSHVRRRIAGKGKGCLLVAGKMGVMQGGECAKVDKKEGDESGQGASCRLITPGKQKQDLFPPF